MDRVAVHEEMERARVAFHELMAAASAVELRRPTDGTRWNNRQLLFHMLLGYLVVRTLRWVIVLFDWLPAPIGRGFARLLNAATVPFDAVNFAGAWLAGTVLPRRAMLALMDGVIAALRRRLDAETALGLARGMDFPTRWDPFFRRHMTMAQLYHYGTEHFEFHRSQLTLDR